MKQSYETTYKSLKDLVSELKSRGIPGYQVVEVAGLTAPGTAGDRISFNITGNKIIVPPVFPVLGVSAVPTYNDDVVFGICLNEEGNDDDDWLDFQILSSLMTYQDPMPVIDNVIFHKITVRNYLPGDSQLIKFWVFQDPQFINQINAMLELSS